MLSREAVLALLQELQGRMRSRMQDTSDPGQTVCKLVSNPTAFITYHRDSSTPGESIGACGSTHANTILCSIDGFAQQLAPPWDGDEGVARSHKVA